jgi:hypothetical protein
LVRACSLAQSVRACSLEGSAKAWAIRGRGELAQVCWGPPVLELA